MAAVELERAPSTLPLYARAALPLVPFASRLPWVAGGGGAIPEDMELALEDVAVDPAHLAQYAKVCGFPVRETLPPTYPHVLAFPLHMALMTDGRFPFGAVGLVHVQNTISQTRPIRATETLAIRVHPTPVRPHRAGRAFGIVTEVRAGRELVWTAESTMLRRGGGSDSAPQTPDAPADLPAAATWSLPGGLGRRYAGVSGDRNPIHLHDLTAKLFGFDKAIAHGMWTKARCVAALEPRLPEAFTVEVRFRKPILLPARVEFATDGDRFAVRDAKRGTPHLDGQINH